MNEIEKNNQIVASVARQLWWSHFVEVMPLKDDLQREFYAADSEISRGCKSPFRKLFRGGLTHGKRIQR